MAVREVTVFLLVFVYIWLAPVDGQRQDCARQIRCGLCIQQPGCAWCYQEGFSGVRCQPAENVTGCDDSFIENPRSSTSETESEESPDTRTINFRNVAANLRVGEPATFTVTVTPQRNLPLDLYILIDVSSSMREELNTVQAISTLIADRIRGVTENVRIGFGSFNEKPLQPFTPQTLVTGEVSSDLADITPYAFRHTVNLTSNSSELSSRIQAVATTVNVDLPENGLEGLAQVIACGDIIGWRERVDGIGTRLILFMSDEEFHFAGEGRLAGIVKPYNDSCQLEPNPEFGTMDYFRSTEFDYPSPGKILELLQKFDVTAILAIADEHLRSYENLAETVLNANGLRAAVAGFTIETTDDTAAQQRILNLIEEQYVSLLQGVSLDFTNLITDPNLVVSVQVVPICPPNTESEVLGEGCTAVPLEETVKFNVTLTLNSCAGITNGDTISHVITTPSFGSFTLDITPICDCQCAELANPNPTSTECMGMGVRRCGVCECDEGKCGVDCSILIGNRAATDCPRGGVDNDTCSGSSRGECDCTCMCIQPEIENQMIFGEACECDNFRCPGNPVCSGRGMCCEGECICDPSPLGNQYRGEDQLNSCQCEPVEEACVDPNDPEVVCNGRGTCGCQSCQCTDSNFGGRFCELDNINVCNSERDERCIREARDDFDEDDLPDVYLDCNSARPLLFINGEEAVSFNISIANTRLPVGAPYALETVRCRFDIGNCQNEYFILGNETDNYVIVVVREQLCRSSVLQLAIPVWALAPIIIGCLLLLGILIVILIKIIFTILDYIEVKKWQKEAQTADFSKNTNPLYQSPEMKYENVAYGKE